MSRSRLEQLFLRVWVVGIALMPVGAGAEEVPFDSSQTIDVVADATRLRAADFDRDGDLDLAGELEDTVWWYERDPTAVGGFVGREVYDYAENNQIFGFEVGDVDGDGWVDVLVYRRVDSNTVILDWLENDGSPTAGSWAIRNIKTWEDQVFELWQAPRSLATGDFDGDGDLDVAVGRVLGTVDLTEADGQIEWIGNDGTPANGGWDGHILRDWISEISHYSLRAGDLDQDGDLDLVGSPEDDPAARPVVWWENDGTPANGAWAQHDIETDLAYSSPCLDDLDLGDIDRDDDVDVIQAVDLNLFWWENDGTPDVGEWTRRQIPVDPTGACSVRLADLDRDGDLDAVTDEPGVGWYENDGTPTTGNWTFRPIENVNCDEVLVADLDGDGDPDVAGSDYTEFFWFENLEIHRSPLLLDESTVNLFVDGAYDLLAVDLDRDGDLDLVSAAEANDHVYWHHNDGTPGGSPWSLSTISSEPDGPRAVAAGDLDRDGDVDLVSASYNDDTIAWYENDGSNANWTARVISNGAGGAQDVLVADLDSDDDLDVGAAQYLDDEISWYRNDGGSPPAFSGFFVDAAAHSGPRAIAAGDLDGDGDLDLAEVSETTDAVVWYVNDGTPDVGEWTLHHTAGDGEADGPKDVALVDLDRDGDLDTVVAGDADGTVWWFENDGSLFDFTARAMNFPCDRARSVVPGDFDGDGDLDGAAAQGIDAEVAWYENVGGQFRVTGAAMAANPLENDAVQPIFRVVVEHRGRSGDGSIELSKVALKLEEEAGDPLGAFEAASLIDVVQIYVDDGDNSFEPTVDLLLASGSAAGIGADGVVWVNLPDGNLGARVTAVTQKRFFVALDLTNPFFDFAPPSLRVTLLTDGPKHGEAEDRSFDLPLDLEPTTSAATATLALADTCGAPEHLVVEDETLAGVASYEACSTIRVGPTVTLEGTAAVSLSARDGISFRGDFAVAVGAELVATIDPDAGAPP